jgi:hypothetical protein
MKNEIGVIFVVMLIFALGGWLGERGAWKDIEKDYGTTYQAFEEGKAKCEKRVAREEKCKVHLLFIEERKK